MINEKPPAVERLLREWLWEDHRDFLLVLAVGIAVHDSQAPVLEPRTGKGMYSIVAITKSKWPEVTPGVN